MSPEEIAKWIGSKFRKSVLESEFGKTLRHLQNTPLVYENNDLLDAALDKLPLERLYSRAEQREQEQQEDTWGTQEYLIMELLKWFKQDFFQWVNTLKCSKCGQDSETRNIGGTQPTLAEAQAGAGVVELHQCTKCRNIERFPRYNHPAKLLETHNGRCGEWANCFTLLCRALGSRTRWVWNSEDHVWTEVYSETQQRWIHCDSCEEAWDKPTIYERGWGKRMAYCIGFSVDGATDVTRRYVRDRNKALPRTKMSETDLKIALDSITQSRRQHLTKDEKRALVEMDRKEQLELESYHVDTTEQVGPRQTGAGAWTAARGEDGGGK